MFKLISLLLFYCLCTKYYYYYLLLFYCLSQSIVRGQDLAEVQGQISIKFIWDHFVAILKSTQKKNFPNQFINDGVLSYLHRTFVDRQTSKKSSFTSTSRVSSGSNLTQKVATSAQGVADFITVFFMSLNDETLVVCLGSKCTANGETGRCVHYKRCLSLIQDRNDGKAPEICSYIGKSPVICCTDCDLVEDIDKIVIDPQVGYRYKDGSKAWDYCLDSYQKLPYLCKEHFSYELMRDWNETRQCHNIRFTAVGASGGENAERGEFPHMALLGYGDETEGLQWLCGGSLISDRFILTAAHCSSSTTLGPVSYAALAILKRSDPEELWQKYKIQDIISHPGYKSPSKYHDIALLKTGTRIKFSVDVLPACVNSRVTTWTEMEWAYGMGWGALGHRKQVADILQKVIIQKFTPEECSELYPPHRHLLSGYNHTTQMCYGDRSDIKDTCMGDSGGPLVTKSGCMYDVTGVTSYGRACGFPGQAGIYTRVRFYVPWIESVVWP